MRHSFWIETVALTTHNPKSIRGWMSWKTYKRYEERFERHEAQLDAGLEKMVAKLKLFESK